MPKFQLPEYFFTLIEQTAPIDVKAKQLDEAIDALLSAYPALKPKILSKDGALHPFVMIFIGKYPITQLQGLRTPLQEDDLITILYNIAGG